MSKKTSISLIALGSVVGGLLIYESFRRSRRNPKVEKIKKWINWEVEFKENTNDHEKTKAIEVIKKYFIDYLSDKKNYGVVSKSIEFEIKQLENMPSTISFKTRFEYIMKIAPKFNPPPRPPVIPVDFARFSPLIEQVKDVNEKKFIFNAKNINQGFQ